MSRRRLATISTSVRDLRWLLEQASVDSRYLYCKLQDDRIEAYSASPVAKRRSFSVFNKYYFSNIRLSGITGMYFCIDSGRAVSALKTISKTEPNQPIRIEIFGDVDTQQPGNTENIQIRLHRQLSWDTYSTTTDIPSVIDRIRERFTEQNRFLTEQQDRLYRTEINISVSDVERLISAMDDIFTKGFYAIDIRNEQLGLSLNGKYGRNTLVFSPYSLRGPDVLKYFTEEFNGVFSLLDGDVTMHVDPDEDDLAVARTGRKGCTLHHVLESIGVDGKIELNV